MPEVSSPTVRRRELGALLRTLRNEQGLTVEQVADELLCSPSKVSRMETGQRGATLRDVRDLCRIYGVTDQIQVDRLMDLARVGKDQGWWQPYDLVSELAPYVASKPRPHPPSTTSPPSSQDYCKRLITHEPCMRSCGPRWTKR